LFKGVKSGEAAKSLKKGICDVALIGLERQTQFQNLHFLKRDAGPVQPSKASALLVSSQKLILANPALFDVWRHLSLP
jgi:hypothetical protein